MTAPPPPARRCPLGYRTATVGVGDDFTALLRRFNVAYSAMVAANPNINPQRLIPGQPLCIPPSGTCTVCVGPSAFSIPQGDDLDALSRRLRTTPAALLQGNPNMAPCDFTPAQIIHRPR